MKIFLIAFLAVLLTTAARAQDTKVSALPEVTSPAVSDILYAVTDPGGTPASKKLTIANLFAAEGISYSAGTTTFSGNLQLGSCATNCWSIDTSAITGTSNSLIVKNGTQYAVFALSAVTNEFLTGLGTDGVLTHRKPALADLSDAITASRLLGRGSAAGAGIPVEITLGTNLSMSGTTLNATGGGTFTGTIANYQIAYGTATDVLGGANNLKYKDGYVQINDPSDNVTYDVGLDRAAAGILKITDGATGDGNLRIPAQKSSSGTRYLCIDTAGNITSSASACSGS